MIEMSRRSFMQTMLALGVAPAVVHASSIMRVRPTLITSIVTDHIVLEDAAGVVLATLRLAAATAERAYPGLYPYPSRWQPSTAIVEQTGRYARAKLHHHSGQVLEVSQLRLHATDLLQAGETLTLTGLTFQLGTE